MLVQVYLIFLVLIQGILESPCRMFQIHWYHARMCQPVNAFTISQANKFDVDLDGE